MARVYNFSAGPAVLPEEVLKEAAEEMLDYRGCGMSVMEMSHRSKMFDDIIKTAEADLRELMNIPDNYKVLFLQGGASQQFSAIPMNLMKNKVADFIITGQWAKKAYQEASRYGKANILASSEDKTYTYIPDCSDLPVSEDADYVYVCYNNTIYGTKYQQIPNTKGKILVADMSSCILSEPVNVEDFGVIYFGVQKNVGPAGVVVCIVREDLITDDVLEGTPTMLKWKTQADADSLYNTPPCYGIYICGKVFKWLKDQGGLTAMKKRNEEKAKILYDFLDQSEMFKGTVVKEDRSLMYTVKCLNPIASKGLDLFTEDFKVIDDLDKADAVLVRSAAMHDLAVPESLLAVARAGAGVNNIPLDEYAKKGIVAFNTPGANANGVKELVVAGLLLASRDIIGGYNWVKENASEENLAKLVEKQKKQYAGNELKGKSIGVIGLGAIGVLVANICNRLGMKVYGYDPYVSVRSAWSLSRMVKHIASIDELFETCDYITIHVPYMDSTKGMINKEAIDKMKDGVTLLNFARGELVDNQAVIEGLASGKVKHYVTDFPSAEIAGVDKVITIPHLGASTEESEENCAEMAVDQLMNYLENGNIVNSVNYPNCDLGEASGAARITVHHKNLPNMIGQLTAILAADGHNISNMLNKSKGEWAYSMFDMEKKAPTEETIKKMEQIDGVVRVRVL